MSYSVELYRSGWNDITDSILRCDRIPFIDRNRDYSLIARQVKMTISGNDAYIPYVYDDLIQVKSDSTVIWSGFVVDSTYNNQTRSYDLVIENDLMLLDRFVIDVGEPSFSAGAFQYDTGGTYPLVNLMYLLKQIFTEAGLTLSTAGIDSEILFTHYFTSNVDVPFNRLLINEDELRCLGQDKAAVYATISAEDDYAEKQITGWEFVRNIVGNLRLGLVITANRSYKLLVPTTNFSISDSTKYSYFTKDHKNKYDNISLRTYTTTEAIAAGSVVTDMTLTSNDGKGTKTFGMINGLSIRFYNYSGGWVNTDDADTALDPRIKSGLTEFNPTITQIDALNQNFTYEEIITDATLTEKTVIENHINIQDDTSRIIQETYELEDNLLMNGNMENNSNWTDYNTPDTNVRNSSQAKYGTYSRKIISGVGGSGAVSKTFDVVSGETYKVTGWVYDVDGSAQITDANGRINFVLNSAGASVWEELTVDVTATSTGTESVRIVCSVGGDEAYFDNITVRKYN